MTLALIPARGGSKGIPRKNIRPIAGKPLIAWTIEAALAAEGIDRVVVSTEDEEIAAVAREWGAEVPFMRPSELASDEAPGIAPVLHAIDQLAGHKALILLQPTSPLRTAEQIDRFEKDLAVFTGVEHAVATVNGTAALHVALVLAGVKAGEEVLMPSLTFIATANACVYAGATPHFVDSEADTLAVDPVALALHLDKIAEMRDGVCFNKQTGARISALVVMHAFGHPAKLEELCAVCKRWTIPLIEDAAESLGSSYRGAHTGNFGLVAALSFNGNKVMTTGGGGAILTNDAELAKRAKHLSTTARVPHRWNFIHDEVGFNYRLPNINAALGCAQLERVPNMLARKRVLADRYAAALGDVDGVAFLGEPEGTTSN